MRTLNIFVAAHGQDDNVGDPALRRAMLEGLAPGCRRHVLVGSASPAYINALGLRDDDRTYTNRREWQIAAFSAAFAGTAVYISNAGEIQLNQRRIRINRVDRLLVGVIRLRGGAAIMTGLGVRDPFGKTSPMLSSLTKACQIATWRDRPSRDFAKAGEVRPDWAFALGSAPEALNESPRPLLVLSMRGDTSEPSAQWVQAVAEIRDRLGLDLVIVSQVERDVDRGTALAKSLGGRIHPWRAGDHLEAERDLRAVYRDARLVISDRLHVLIFAVTEGAVPLYLPNVESEKIPRTMAVAHLEEFRADASDPHVGSIAEMLVERRSEIAGRIETARAALADLSDSMNSLILRGAR